MAALTQIPEHFIQEYGTNWEHLLQQKVSKLREYVQVDTISGKEKSYNQMAATSMRLITSRSGVTTAQETATAKRWVREKGYDAVTLFDEFDRELLGSVVLPTSETVNNHAMAYKRTCDQVIIDALGGTNYIGETGVTPVDLPAAQKVAVNYVTSGSPANSGLTLAKIIKAKSILGKNEVEDGEELIMVYTQQQLDDLLNNVNEVKSSDYNQIKALVEGSIDRFMGFKWVRTQLCPLDTATDVRRIYAYVKSGVTLADSGRQVYMDIRADLNHSLQIRSVARLGATRREEGKIVEIACDESP